MTILKHIDKLSIAQIDEEIKSTEKHLERLKTLRALRQSAKVDVSPEAISDYLARNGDEASFNEIGTHFKRKWKDIQSVVAGHEYFTVVSNGYRGAMQLVRTAKQKG